MSGQMLTGASGAAIQPRKSKARRVVTIALAAFAVLAVIAAFALYNLYRLINPPIEWSELPAPTPTSQGCPSWRIMKGVHAGGFLSDYKISLSRVEAFSNSDVWALGTVNWRWNGPNFGGSSFNPYPDLVLHWNGQHWNRVNLSTLEKPQSPDITARNFSISDIRAVAPDDVWLLGTYYAATQCSPEEGCTGSGRAFYWHWDGHNWRNANAPPSKPSGTAGGGKHVKPANLQPPLPDAKLYLDAVMLTDGSVWAVGGFDAGEQSTEGYALAAEYTGRSGYP